jgi:hypothetical protein
MCTALCVSVAMTHRCRLLTHIGPKVDEVVMDDLIRRKFDVFHWKAESPSCLCWSQRSLEKTEMTGVLNRLMNVNPVPIVCRPVSTRSRNEYHTLTKATIDR